MKKYLKYIAESLQDLVTLAAITALFIIIIML